MADVPFWHSSNLCKYESRRRREKTMEEETDGSATAECPACSTTGSAADDRTRKGRQLTSCAAHRTAGSSTAVRRTRAGSGLDQRKYVQTGRVARA